MLAHFALTQFAHNQFCRNRVLLNYPTEKAMKRALKRYGLPMASFLGLFLIALAIKWLFNVTLIPVVPMIGVLVATAWYAGRGPGLMLAITFEALATLSNRTSHIPDSVMNTIGRLTLFLVIAV